MSFTLTYGDLANPNFIGAMKKLTGSNHYKDIKSTYNISRIGSLVDQELKTFHELRTKVKAKIDALPAEEREAAAETEGKTLSEISFKLERHKVKLEDIEGAGLTPNELLALEPLLDASEPPKLEAVK